VQGILGHARVQTVFDLYTDEDLDEMIAAGLRMAEGGLW